MAYFVSGGVQCSLYCNFLFSKSQCICDHLVVSQVFSRYYNCYWALMCRVQFLNLHSDLDHFKVNCGWTLTSFLYQTLPPLWKSVHMVVQILPLCAYFSSESCFVTKLGCSPSLPHSNNVPCTSWLESASTQSKR